MKKVKKSRQSYLVVWCIVLLCTTIVSCTQMSKYEYPEVKELCQIYANSHVNGTDTVEFCFKIDTTTAGTWKVIIIGDDSTRVTYDLNDNQHVRKFTEINANGDTIFKFPCQEKLHEYHIEAYIDPLRRMAEKKQYEGTYQLITNWFVYASEDELSIIYIDKETSISPHNKITSIYAKISKNYGGYLRVCNDSKMGYKSLIDDWMDKDHYYAERTNIEIKKVLNALKN